MDWWRLACWRSSAPHLLLLFPGLGAADPNQLAETLPQLFPPSGVHLTLDVEGHALLCLVDAFAEMADHAVEVQFVGLGDGLEGLLWYEQVAI